MGMTIKCSTLFDITRTGVTNRKSPVGLDITGLQSWSHDRNTQYNFDTIIQVLSLRAQPENITNPVKISATAEDLFIKFGTSLKYDKKISYNIWSFNFYIDKDDVFNEHNNKLGSLYSDCSNVPIINVNSDLDKSHAFLDVSKELRNIYFEIISHE